MIESLKDLEKFLRLCRRQGITKTTFGQMSFEFGELPEAKIADQIEEKAGKYDNFPAGELTPEQLAFYSSGGSPEDDPSLKDNPQ